MLPKNRPGGRQSARLRQTLGGHYGRPITGHLHHQQGHDPLMASCEFRRCATRIASSSQVSSSTMFSTRGWQPSGVRPSTKS